MGLNQFINSMTQIQANPRVDTCSGVRRHLLWQARKLLNLFPYEQRISQSRIVAYHRRCGVSALIHSQGMYDYNNMHFVKFLLQDGGVFLDVGANIGSYTLIASEQQKAQVFAFEPHPVTFEFLQKNVELNCRDNVTLTNVAVGAKEGTVWFADSPGSSINHVIQDEADQAIRVPCVRLDCFCREHRINADIVKIDVEGFERDVLDGIGDHMARIKALFVELTGSSVEREQVSRDLRKAGLSGPFAVDFSNRLLSHGFHSEDPVYFRSDMMDQLRAEGFCIVKHSA